MTPQSRSDDVDVPQRSLGARIAGFVERTCVLGVVVSRPLIIVTVGMLSLYFVGGFILIQLGLWTPPYPFLSLTDDVYFAWFAFLTGCTACVGTGSMIGIAFLENGEGPVHNEVSILASFIGFGFGAGVVRMTYAVVLASLT